MSRLRIIPTVRVVGVDGLPTRDGFNLLSQLADKPGKYTLDVPATTGTTATVKHGLGSLDVVVSVRMKATGAQEAVTVTIVDQDTLTLTWGGSTAAETRKVTVIG